ncbi:MAG: hypothetical protein ACI9W1_000986, partial [Candidatus Azotimanducaceae bacterium]
AAAYEPDITAQQRMHVGLVYERNTIGDRLPLIPVTSQLQLRHSLAP